jgi:transcriptional regulator with XRE-family HTH domain/tetratricopeptide (TPR) repeat protein
VASGLAARRVAMDERDVPAFGNLVRRHRAAAGLTQEGLAERAGLSPLTVSALERGVNVTPRKETVALLAKALELTAEYRAVFEAAARRGGAPVQASPPARYGRALPPLVGRAGELALLERHLAGGGPPVLLLAGEPGIGKSRLLVEARRLAVGQGYCVLEGGCQRQGDQDLYAPLVQALERHLAGQPSSRRGAALQGCGWLARLLPELAGEAEGPLPSLRPEQERRLMFGAVGRYLANVAGPAGVVLVLDDLQWAGQDGLDLLVAVVRQGAALPLRVVGAYRDTDLQPRDALSLVLADLSHGGLALHRALAPLSVAEAASLLESLLAGSEGDGPALRARLAQRLGGVPFYLVSGAQALQLGERGGVEAAIPWDVTQSIRQRVSVLPETAQVVLGVAAAVGRLVDPAVLTMAAARPEDEVLNALDRAVRAGLLLEEAGGYRFTHDLIREGVERELGVARRRVLHRRIAEALEQRLGEALVERLAHHYGQSDLPEKAIVYLGRAGDAAQARYAHAAAEEHYRALLGRLDELGRAAEAARVREKLGRTLLAQGRYDAALAVLEEAAERYRLAGDLLGQGRTVAEIGMMHAHRGTRTEGIERLRPLVALLEGQEPSQALAALHLSLADLSYMQDGMEAAAERAAELALIVGDRRILAHAGVRRSVAQWARGDARALAVAEEALALAEVLDDLEILCDAVQAVAWLNWIRGDFARSLEYYDRAVRVAGRLGDPNELSLMLGERGQVAFQMGSWSWARADLEQAVEVARQRDISPHVIPAIVGLVRLSLAEEGASEEAHRQLESLGQLSDERTTLLSSRIVLPDVETAQAEYELMEGKSAAAHARLMALRDRMAKEWDEGFLDLVGVLPLLGRARLDLGECEPAEQVAALATSRARARGDRLPLVEALWVHGMALACLRRWAEATASLEEALALARALPYPYAEGRLQRAYGQLLAEQGEPRAARERLEAARAIFTRLGARRDSERVEGDLAALPA